MNAPDGALPHTPMKETTPMIRTLIAAMWLIASALHALAAEIIDRQPVANGGEVVMELVRHLVPHPYYQYSYRTKTGIDWLFYREPVMYKDQKKKKFFERDKLHSMLFNDHRISLADAENFYFKIVTLELDSAAPKIYVDRFINPYRHSMWSYELKAADELNICYLNPGEGTTDLMLKRDKEGFWMLDGTHYQKNVVSKVYSVPLLPMGEVPKEKLGIGKAVAEIIERKPVSGGAEVVLKLIKEDGHDSYYQYCYRSKIGIDWVFYQKLVNMKNIDDCDGPNDCNWLFFDEHEVVIIFPDKDDYITLTLDVGAASPNVRMDRLVDFNKHWSGGLRIAGVGKFEFNDYSDPSPNPKLLQHNESGAWFLDGIRYPFKVETKISAVPLTPLQPVPGQKE